MKRHTGTGLRGIVGTSDAAVSWYIPAAATLFTIAAFSIIYHGTVLSMMSVWAESDTFAHGYLTFPISAFLVWRKRHELAGIQPEPHGLGAAVLAIPGFLWLLGYVSDVQVVQQYAFVSIIILLVWVLLGWKVFKLLAFPLGFLLFAVPFGKFLVPYMIDFSAAFAISALRLTGVPVYAEGATFSTPGVDWKVVEVCSGMRYLIAAVFVGTLYAYLRYQSLHRRILFVVATIVVTLVASGLRVYLVVMLGHFVDMRYAKGFDHLFIGWVFFGIVIFFMFWVGSFWHEDAEAEVGEHRKHNPEGQASMPPGRRWVAASVLSLLVLLVWPAAGAWIKQRTEAPAHASVQVPASLGGWSPAPDLVTDWRPVYQGYDAEVSQTYSKGGRRVGIHLLYYKAQRQGAELINARNRIVKRGVWQSKARSEPDTIRAPGLAIDVMKTELESAGRNLLVYQWNWFDGRYISSPYAAKLVELEYKLLGQQLPGAAIIVFTDDNGGAETARQTLHAFVSDMLPSIERELNRAANRDETQ